MADFSNSTVLPNFNRRRVVLGLAAVPAMAIPAAAAPISNVDLAGRVHDLAEKTSEAFGAWSALHGGSWELRIRAASDPCPIMFANLAAKRRTPAQRVAEAKVELAAALEALHPEVADWRSLAFPDSENVVGMYMIVGHREAQS